MGFNLKEWVIVAISSIVLWISYIIWALLGSFIEPTQLTYGTVFVFSLFYGLVVLALFRRFGRRENLSKAGAVVSVTSASVVFAVLKILQYLSLTAQEAFAGETGLAASQVTNLFRFASPLVLGLVILGSFNAIFWSTMIYHNDDLKSWLPYIYGFVIWSLLVLVLTIFL